VCRSKITTGLRGALSTINRVKAEEEGAVVYKKPPKNKNKNLGKRREKENEEKEG